MDSYLNCRGSTRWGDNYKVYTRKRRRKTLENTNTASVTADDVAVIQFTDSSTRKGDTFSEVVVAVSNDECTRGSELRDPINVENHRHESQSCNLEGENNNGYVVKPVISRIQDSDEHTRGSAGDGELRDPTEVSSGRDVENHRHETQSCNLEVENNNGYVVKPVVISSIQDSDEHTRGSAGDGKLRDPTEGSSGRDVENHGHETQNCNLEVENNNEYVVKPVVISRIQDSDEHTRGSAGDGELRDPTEGSSGRDVDNHRHETQSCNLEVENNNGYVVKPVAISSIQDSHEHTRGSAGDGELRDPTEGSSGGDVENHRDETQSCNLEGENNNGYVVKPVVSRIQDRIRINLKGLRFKDEIKELSMSLESELDQVRSLVKEVEAKQFQLTTCRSTSINGGSVTTVPGGSVSSYSHSQYNMDNGVIKNRSLVRMNSDVRSVGHIGSRPFQRPSFLIVENSNGSSDFMEKEKRTPKANQYYRNSEFLLGKDRLPPESNKRMRPNGSGKKHSGDSENGFGFGFDKHRLQVFRNCGSLLERLMKHQHGWVFNEPVNAKALGLHDYHVIITHPMDLGTIKTRLSQNWYKSPREFAEDVRLVFYNAMTYNPKGQDVHVMAEHLSEIFEERWAVIEAEYNSDWRHQTYHDAGTPTPTSRRTSFAPSFLHTPVASHSLAPIARQLQTLDRSESMTRPVNPRMKTSNIVHVARTPIPKKPKAKDPNKRDMTYEEKQKLSTNLQGLPTEKLDAIVQIIKKRNSTLNQDNDEIEVDIDSVDAETLWELDRFVTNFKKSFSKYKRKAELALRAREVAAQTARIVNLTSEVADAPRENGTGEKDTTPATLAEGGRLLDSASRSSSSSSSSSDSGSSSSDSDSDSSSASGSEAAHSPRT